MANTDILKDIEESFSMIKMKRGSIDSNLNDISKSLSTFMLKEYKSTYEFTLSVSENIPHDFFGMTLYPTEESMQDVLNIILDDKVDTNNLIEKWNGGTSWHIEIDNKLFFDRNLNANPSEMVAVLLHEIGHVLGTNSIPIRLKNKFRDKLLKMNIETRVRVQNAKFRPILYPAIIEACSTKMYRYVGRSNELAADKYAKKLGYGEELNSFLNKVIVSYGNRLTQVTENEAEKDIDIMIDWCAEAIDELKYRKTKLKKSLITQSLKTPCKYVKGVLNKIKDSFFGFSSTKDFDDKFGTLESSIFQAYDRIQVAQELYEDGFRECDQILQEMFFSKRNKKIKKIDPLDLDYINIEIDKIVTDDDKIYVLDLIYYQTELVDKSIDTYTNGDRNLVQDSIADLKSYKEELRKMRVRAAGVKIKRRNPLDISIKVDYPEGFEG